MVNRNIQTRPPKTNHSSTKTQKLGDAQIQITALSEKQLSPKQSNNNWLWKKALMNTTSSNRPNHHCQNTAIWKSHSGIKKKTNDNLQDTEMNRNLHTASCSWPNTCWKAQGQRRYNLGMATPAKSDTPGNQFAKQDKTWEILFGARSHKASCRGDVNLDVEEAISL